MKNINVPEITANGHKSFFYLKCNSFWYKLKSGLHSYFNTNSTAWVSQVFQDTLRGLTTEVTPFTFPFKDLPPLKINVYGSHSVHFILSFCQSRFFLVHGVMSLFGDLWRRFTKHTYSTIAMHCNIISADKVILV